MAGGAGTTRTLREGGDSTVQVRPVPGLVVLWSELPIPGDGIYPFQREMTIGREPDCTVFFNDPGLSRRHAVIRWMRGKLSVGDQGSHNGTFLEGRRLEVEEPLPFRAILRCGSTILMSVPDTEMFRGWRIWGPEQPLVGGPLIREVREEIRTVATTELGVLVQGESGTGKEVVVGEVHRQSGRKGPLVAVNCAELPESLFEAELFGAARGAFTGAERERVGLVQQASEGTLFLDEVTELPLPMQAKLLRVVEQKEVRPLGQPNTVKVDVRLIAATNRELSRVVEAGEFREDLYHRLRGADLRLPPLRKRRTDIPLLVKHFAGDGAPPPSVVCLEHLLLYRWPGNVRQLANTLREAEAHAAARGKDRILAKHLRPELQVISGEEDDGFEEVRRGLIEHNGNVARVAKQMGISRPQVYKQLARRGMDVADFRRR